MRTDGLRGQGGSGRPDGSDSLDVPVPDGPDAPQSQDSRPESQDSPHVCYDSYDSSESYDNSESRGSYACSGSYFCFGSYDRCGSYDTLFLGGGTPSLLSIGQLAEIVAKVQKTFSFTSPVEWTIEANPDDVTLPYLRDLRSLGFNRLSLGIQSLRDEKVTWLGRRHTAAQGVRAIENARLAGFDNLSIDLIYGLPARLPGSPLNPRNPLNSQSPLNPRNPLNPQSSSNSRSPLAQWLQELEQVLAYKPEHLSCYQLSYEPHTRLSLQRSRGLIQPLDERKEAGYFLETSRMLESAGYWHYEVSNFSRGEEWTCRHNRKYWQHVPYLGLGPAAHSFSRNQRHWNHRSLSLYCQSLHQGILPIDGEEHLGPEELRLETLYLGFRTRWGIHLGDFLRYYGQDLLSNPPGLASRLIDEKKLEVRADRLCPTPRGLAVADSLALLW
jgi:oxygen-independent coproporphyrinogen-3 oxidase